MKRLIAMLGCAVLMSAAPALAQTKTVKGTVTTVGRRRSDNSFARTSARFRHSTGAVWASAVRRWNAAQRHALSFYTQASIDMVRDEELLGLLRDANFVMMFIGIESPRKASLPHAPTLVPPDDYVTGVFVQRDRRSQAVANASHRWKAPWDRSSPRATGGIRIARRFSYVVVFG